MKVVKPSLLSFNFRVLLTPGRQELTLTSLVAFVLGTGARRLLADIVLWPLVGEAIGEAVLDEGLPKPGGEVLVYGVCHTPRGQSLPTCAVRVAVGPTGSTSGDGHPVVDKRLAVFGDRYWIPRGSGSGAAVTQPAPFLRMPISWERAFGGEEYPKNPRGRGIAAVPAPDGQNRVPLPNVEHPANPVSSPSQRPEPASLGPIDIGWPQRRAKAGTYDAAWLEDGFPGYARDTDPTFFCTAPPDQRAKTYFRGDEEYLLENLHPTHESLRGTLPGVSARTFLQRKRGGDVEEVRTCLDTIVLFPEQDLGVLVFRGTAPVVEDDAADVASVLAALEELGEPRPAEHYVRAFRRRLAKKQIPLLAIREDDLVPVFARRMGIAEVLKTEPSPRAEELEKKFRAQLRKQLVDGGLEPAEADAAVAKKSAKEAPAAALPDLGDPEAVDAFEQEIEAADAAAKQEVLDLKDGGIEREIRAMAQADPLPLPGGAEAMSLIAAAAAAPVEEGPGGPPPPEAPRMIAAIREAEHEPDPAEVKALEEGDALALESYREMAHLRAPARVPGDGARRALRERAVNLQREGKSFAELDLTRGDLSDFDVRRADFRRALLEAADCTRTNAAGADFSGAVLARVLFHESVFDDATLRRANLGAASMERASFAGADLDHAVLARAKLVSVSFARANLARVDWSDAELGAVDFEGAQLAGLSFLRPIDLSRCRFPGARLPKANFVETNLAGVDFTGADSRARDLRDRERRRGVLPRRVAEEAPRGRGIPPSRGPASTAPIFATPSSAARTCAARASTARGSKGPTSASATSPARR